LSACAHSGGPRKEGGKKRKRGGVKFSSPHAFLFNDRTSCSSRKRERKKTNKGGRRGKKGRENAPLKPSHARPKTEKIGGEEKKKGGRGGKSEREKGPFWGGGDHLHPNFRGGPVPQGKKETSKKEGRRMGRVNGVNHPCYSSWIGGRKRGQGKRHSVRAHFFYRRRRQPLHGERRKVRLKRREKKLNGFVRFRHPLPSFPGLSSTRHVKGKKTMGRGKKKKEKRNTPMGEEFPRQTLNFPACHPSLQGEKKGGKEKTKKGKKKRTTSMLQEHH